MSFISYAQNFEDVMLWRALKSIKNGFYVDVGAWSPDIDSVTRLFYENGWTGINIEPNPEFHQQLQEKRTRDINLSIAVSDTSGNIQINFLSNPGLSTIDDKIAQEHIAHGYTLNKRTIQAKTLEQVFNENISHTQNIHFLKIDVEGLEQAVLQSNNWSKNRPWIVVIESTLPMTNIECHHVWENILLENKYIFSYADGLNRFYVANEHHELVSAFKYPPNVFDNFTLAQQHTIENRAIQAENRATQAENRATQAENRATQAENRATQAENRATHAETKTIQTEQQLQSLLISKSWRITYPLRWIAHQIRIIQAKKKYFGFKIIFYKFYKKIENNKIIRKYVMIILNKNPKLKYAIKIFALKMQHDFMFNEEQNKLEDVTPYAKQIYLQLKNLKDYKKGD